MVNDYENIMGNRDFDNYKQMLHFLIKSSNHLLQMHQGHYIGGKGLNCGLNVSSVCQK